MRQDQKDGSVCARTKPKAVLAWARLGVKFALTEFIGRGADLCRVPLIFLSLAPILISYLRDKCVLQVMCILHTLNLF